MLEALTTRDLVGLVRGFARLRAERSRRVAGAVASDAVWEAIPLRSSYHGMEEIREIQASGLMHGTATGSEETRGGEVSGGG
jgi:hypothetical protein